MNRKKIFITSFITLLFSLTYGQISGDITKDNRKPTTNQAFVIEGHVTGKIVFEISVDNEGKVTSAKVIESESTIKSSPAKIKARNHVMTFQFEPGTWFPKYHQGRVAITMVRPK
ncbi:MAG TPA: hypothetical protein VKX31_04540 [Brumimicrobium sp.]|nr:hypothetical protein [Brumimicrobium sp.]